MAVDIQTQPVFVIGQTARMPIEGLVSTGPRNYDIMPDGKFIVVVAGRVRLMPENDVGWFANVGRIPCAHRW